VWKRGFFGWKYKGKKKDLAKAYDQLLQYREALENPPLLVVCDLARFEIHTNFTGTPTEVHEIALKHLGEPRNLEIRRRVFHDPEKLKPGKTSEAITTEAAERIAAIAQALRDRGLPARDVARFLDRVVFSLFAEDIGLLPGMLFTRLLDKTRTDPERFKSRISELFGAMADGGDFGVESIRRFNGDLFVEGPVLDLTPDEIEELFVAAKLDWSAVKTGSIRPSGPRKRSSSSQDHSAGIGNATCLTPTIEASGPCASPGPSLVTTSVPPSSRNELSPSSTTNVPPGSTSRIASSTKLSSLRMAGRRTSPTSRSSTGCSS
jgi:hypothetical protein